MNVDRTRETIYIRTELDIEKLLVFLRSNARRVQFWVDPRLVDRLLERLEEFVRRHQWKLRVEVVRADGGKTLTGAAGGAVVGSVVGGALGGLGGAVAGAVIGGTCGAALAHMRVIIDLDGEAGGAVVVLR